MEALKHRLRFAQLVVRKKGRSRMKPRVGLRGSYFERSLYCRGFLRLTHYPSDGSGSDLIRPAPLATLKVGHYGNTTLTGVVVVRYHQPISLPV